MSKNSQLAYESTCWRPRARQNKGPPFRIIAMQDESLAISNVSLIRNPVDRHVSRMCAEIHMKEIPKGFLPTFGVGFLSHLYSYIAESDKSFLIVASTRGEVYGFISGTYGNGSLYKSFVVQKFFKVVIPIALRLLRPGAMSKIIEILKYPAGESMDDLPGSEILNFCVSGACQGQGVGQSLFRALCGEFHQKGIDRIRIVTGSNQASARRFYASAGATKAADINIHGNISSEIYVYTIKDPGA